MKKTNTTREYKFENGYHATINDEDITIHFDDGSVAISEDIEVCRELHEVLSKLLKEIK